MNFIKYASLFLFFGAVILPGCASKKRTQAAQIENQQVEDRMIASEENAPEQTSSKEDLSSGL